jgi:hypothetical protein
MQGTKLQGTEFDFERFDVFHQMQRESTSCFNTIRESWDVIDKIASKNGGLHDLSKQFHMCRYIFIFKYL